NGVSSIALAMGSGLYLSGLVCLLIKSIYDYSLFVYKNDSIFVTSLLYVDDILLIGNSPGPRVSD
ncbi:hypothetical protein, partial [Citrobacter freundii]|uniref:hypothetical protein n=1 Tax=Citrobacter freundii TaxID=546 RepID=UPI001952EDD1